MDLDTNHQNIKFIDINKEYKFCTKNGHLFDFSYSISLQ